MSRLLGHPRRVRSGLTAAVLSMGLFWTHAAVLFVPADGRLEAGMSCCRNKAGCCCKNNRPSSGEAEGPGWQAGPECSQRCKFLCGLITTRDFVPETARGFVRPLTA
ncbi:MAG: hypothetical protein K6T59_05345, partial [Bryobacteraceae bacterium]|nr:hypothetical protein [Bryobacteraceae bacterium]